jgi:hypothetical protein
MTNPKLDQAAISAAEALARTITAENQALSALDLPVAVRLLAQKRQHGEAFLAAQARALAAGLPALPRDRLKQLADLAADNKRLLERAIIVQGRVISSIARAVPRAVAGPNQRYACDGKPAGGRPIAMALSARV